LAFDDDAFAAAVFFFFSIRFSIPTAAAIGAPTEADEDEPADVGLDRVERRGGIGGLR
jgi:hypothetical protein